MSVRALSPPGAHFSTVEGPRGDAHPIEGTRVPIDRVTLSTDARRGEGAVLTTWAMDSSSAVDLLPVMMTRGSNGASAPSVKASSAAEQADAGPNGATTPPTVADRARSAVHARLIYSRTAAATDTPVTESARGTGLDSPPDTPAPDVLPGAGTQDGAGETAATSTPGRRTAAKKSGLSVDQQLLVDELKTRDRQVRSHEAAHMAAGGSLTGAASYTYEQGPDGRSYAVGGEVPISLPAGSNPRETIELARQVRAAALAPADPSAQDLRVAAEASVVELTATLELAQSQRAKAPTKAAARYRAAP